MRENDMLLNRLAALFLLAVIAAPYMAGIITVSESVSIDFDKNAYDLNDTVTVEVSLNGYSLPVEMALEARAPNGGLVWIDEENVTASPLWVQFRLPGTGAPEGEYTLYVAVQGETPEEFSFLVKKPTFQIISTSISRVSVPPGAPVTIKAVVKNTGSEGPFQLRLYTGSSLLASSPTITLGYMQSITVEIPFTAPPVRGNHYYRLEAYNAKYGVSDDNATFFISVSTATTTVLPPPPPPPTSPATTTTPGTTSTVSSSTGPGGTPIFVANFTSNIGPDNRVKTNIVVVNPVYNTKLVVPAGTKIDTPPGEKPGVIKMKPVSKVPEHPGSLVLGTPMDFGPNNTRFDPPIILEMHFNPDIVPQGYAVQLAYYDDAQDRWVPLPTVDVDLVNGVVRGRVSHFTIIAPIGVSVITVVSPTTVTKTIEQTRTTTVTATATQPPTTITVTATQVSTSPVTVSTTVTETSTVHSTEKTTTTVTSTVTTTQVKTQSLVIAAVLVLVVVLAAALAYRRS